jgi:uncharacterized protein
MQNGIICLANNLFETLLAISHQEQQQGLMYVEPPVPVMTFVYATPQVNRFWMANTPSPLDIVFCHQGQVKQICYGQPYSTLMIGDHQLSDLVIELPLGTTRSCGIKLGHNVRLLKPTQEELRKIVGSTFSYF